MIYSKIQLIVLYWLVKTEKMSDVTKFYDFMYQIPE